MPSTDDETVQTALDMTLPSKLARAQEKTYLPSMGESVIIDKANKTIDIFSSGAYTKTIAGDVTNNIKGNQTDIIGKSVDIEISGDQTVVVKGGVTSKCSGAYSEEVSGSFQSEVKGNISTIGSGKVSVSSTGDFSVDSKSNANISATQGITLSASGGLATLKLAQGGKFEITGSAGGFVDLVMQLIDAITQISVGTGTGPSGNPLNAAQMIAIKTKLSTMKA
jgi:hypothetical protein